MLFRSRRRSPCATRNQLHRAISFCHPPTWRSIRRRSTHCRPHLASDPLIRREPPLSHKSCVRRGLPARQTSRYSFPTTVTAFQQSERAGMTKALTPNPREGQRHPSAGHGSIRRPEPLVVRPSWPGHLRVRRHRAVHVGGLERGDVLDGKRGLTESGGSAD